MNLSNRKLIERVVLSVTAGTIFLVGTTFVFNNSKSSEKIADSSNSKQLINTRDNSGIINGGDNPGIINGGDNPGTMVNGDYYNDNIQRQINNPVNNIKNTTTNHKSETNFPNLRSNVNCNGQVKDGICNANVNGNVNFTSQH